MFVSAAGSVSEALQTGNEQGEGMTDRRHGTAEDVPEIVKVLHASATMLLKSFSTESLLNM